MQCTQCQQEFAEGTKFCPECGHRVAEAVPPVVVETPAAEAPEPVAEAPDSLPLETVPPEPTIVTAPAPVAAPAFAPAEVAPHHIAEPPVEKHKRHGCLISFGVFLLLIALAAAVLCDLPMRLGLISSPADEMFSGADNRKAEAVLLQDFAEARQPSQGISIFVLPYQGRGYSLAYVILDQSKGYHYVDTGFENPVFAAFQIVARSKAVQQAQIYRVSIEFREADGKTLSVLTAPVFSIQQYAAKSIDKKKFIATMDGHANLARMYKDQYSWLGGPQ